VLCTHTLTHAAVATHTVNLFDVTDDRFQIENMHSTVFYYTIIITQLYQKLHRESSLYLPCRFSQLSIDIPGDVLFRKMDHPKLLNLARKSKNFTDLRRRIPSQSTSKLSSIACGSTVSGGYLQAGASETCGKRVQGHFSKDRPRSGPCPAAVLAPVVAPWPSVPHHK